MISKKDKDRAEKVVKIVTEKARGGDPAIKDEMISVSILCPICKNGTLYASRHNGKTNMRCSIEGCVGWGNVEAKQKTKRR